MSLLYLVYDSNRVQHWLSALTEPHEAEFQKRSEAKAFARKINGKVFAFRSSGLEDDVLILAGYKGKLPW